MTTMPRKSKDSHADPRAYALRLLNYRSRSKKELSERLSKKGFSNRQIKETIAYLEDIGLIQDKKLASELLRHSIENKFLGQKGVRVFLMSRGLDKGLIDKVLSDYTPEMEEKAAFAFVKKKIRALKGYSEEIIKHKLWGMLQRRGFSTEVINKTINSIEGF
jgi:regulatory protein